MPTRRAAVVRFRTSAFESEQPFVHEPGFRLQFKDLYGILRATRLLVVNQEEHAQREN